MRRYALFALVAMLFACSKTVVVSVPPRMDLQRYETLGIVEFASNSGRAMGARAARQFQEEIQSAQPGTRFIELGERDAVLAAIGATQLDLAAFRKIREKYGVAAVFLGEISYSEPTMDVKLGDLAKLEGGVRSEVKGDISSRLVETATGASVWSRSAWARRQIGSLQVSAERGVSGGMKDSNPREAMLPALAYELTHDFRPTSQRQPAK
jgi:hypothetical protein